VALIDSEGRKSEADPDKFGYIPDDRNIFLENVNPRVTDRGQAIFTLALTRRASSSSWATRISRATTAVPCPLASESGLPQTAATGLKYWASGSL